MLTVLLKKQFLSTFKGAVQRSTIGKKKGKGSVVLYVLLMVYLLVIFAGMFFTLMRSLCAPLHQMGLDWLYFLYAAIMATVLGIFGTVFMAQAQLYDAKDNELLLSLPIPPGYILFCRMVPIYAQILLFEALALVPCFVVYATVAGFQAVMGLAWLLMLLLVPLFGLILSCLLGWLVAQLVSRMRNKTLFTILLSLVFLVGYYVIYFRFSTYLSQVLASSLAIGSAIEEKGRIRYLVGSACQGDFGALALVALVILALFALMYWVLSRTYLNILTAKHTAAKVKYRQGRLHSRSEDAALLQKEWKRFLSSATYMLNAGFGVPLLIVGTAAAVLKKDTLLTFLSAAMPQLTAALPMALTAFITFVSATNLVSAPSVSLEGNTLWILQSLPVDPGKVLQAKLKLHCLISAPVAVICGVVLSVVFGSDFVMTVLTVVTPVVAIGFFGCFGLVVNLLKPRMEWDNEALVVKQSASVTIVLFANWGILAAMIGCYAWIGSKFSPAAYLLLCIALFTIGFAVLYGWLMKKGSSIFATL